MKYRVILGCCLLLALSQIASAAKVYTWTDANGVTHYGEHPPKGVTAKKINARTGHSEPVPVPTAEPPSTVENQTQEETSGQPQNRKNPERCEIARKNLETLNSNARIKMPDADGNMRFLTEEERQAKFAEMEKAIEESCE